MAYGTNAPFGLRPVCSIDGGSWTEKTNEYLIYASDDGATTYATSIFTGDPVVFGTSIAATPAVNGKIGTIARYNPLFIDNTPSTFSTVPLVGVFMGCRYFPVNSITGEIQSAYWPAATHVQPGTQIKAMILDDPSALFDIQVSTSIAAAANAFVGLPYFPNTNTTGAGANIYAGSFGRDFALNIGGGGGFETVNASYANNPAAGNVITGQSAFYLDVSTSTSAAPNNHDYSKTVTTLPIRALAYTLNPKNVAAPGLTIETTPFINVTVRIVNHVNAGSATAATVYIA